LTAWQLDQWRSGSDLSSNNVMVIVILLISNKSPLQLRSGARNQFSDRDNSNTYINNHLAATFEPSIAWLDPQWN
jgi:hypothetical protein